MVVQWQTQKREEHGFGNEILKPKHQPEEKLRSELKKVFSSRKSEAGDFHASKVGSTTKTLTDFNKALCCAA